VSVFSHHRFVEKSACQDTSFFVLVLFHLLYGTDPQNGGSYQERTEAAIEKAMKPKKTMGGLINKHEFMDERFDLREHPIEYPKFQNERDDPKFKFKLSIELTLFISHLSYLCNYPN
jgi:hypothetical protein